MGEGNYSPRSKMHTDATSYPEVIQIGTSGSVPTSLSASRIVGGQRRLALLLSDSGETRNQEVKGTTEKTTLTRPIIIGFEPRDYGRNNMGQSLTNEEAKELLTLCRAGRLYDIEKWIADGKSLQIPSIRKKTLLQVVVDIGFHSLVELIAKHESSQSSKNAALAGAVSLRRLDLLSIA